MFSVAIRSLWAHKRRLLSTVAAVAIGVSFLAGTLVLGDTTRASFDDLFSRVNAGRDVVIRPAALGGGDEADESAVTVLLDQSLAARIAGVDGVERVSPGIAGFGRIIGSDGKPLGGMGPPAIASSWDDDAELNPYHLVEGAAPASDTDVVIDKAAADAGHLHVGDRTTVQTPQPVPVTVTGIVRFGERDSAGGSTF